MAFIFSPLTEDVLDSPYEPLPRGVFVMLQLGQGRSSLETEIEASVLALLKNKKLKPNTAASERTQKDYLAKIIQLIRGSGFGVAIFSEYTPATTLANIFFEVALCNLLGKPALLVKSEDAKAPSDFARTEWVTYRAMHKTQFKTDFTQAVQSIFDLAGYYERLGNIAMGAEDIDLELAFERYRQAFLINGRKDVKEKIMRLTARAREDGDTASILKPARTRFRAATNEFIRFLHDA